MQLNKREDHFDAQNLDESLTIHLYFDKPISNKNCHGSKTAHMAFPCGNHIYFRN